ncbi:MAG: 4Fe-4S binding protein [Candidatus Zipacnadales bacterium]
MPRVGVFICQCGTNIAKTVDTEKVAQEAAKLPDVAYAATYVYMCSSAGQQMIEDAIREHNLDAIVVSACTPQMHQKTFEGCAERAGLNRYMATMANIREQCSYVHTDRDLATQKTLELTAMAVAKAARDEPLFQSEAPITRRALIIGGGVAGIQAALDIADAGYEVTIVERTPSIGGRMSQFDKTFPTLDCSACILTPKMVEAYQHPNIRLLTYSEVEQVGGFVGNFEVKIRKRARSVDEEKCTGCGTCWEKCPSKKIPSEYDEHLGNRTAIYVPFPQAVPLVPVIDRANCIKFKTGKCGVCQKVCPANAIDYEQEDEIIEETFGAIVVATGFDTWDPSDYGEYGAGTIPDVITGIQFERMLNLAGPTQGKILRPSDGREAKRVVFVQCVGSRDDKHGYPYCSKVCCMYTAKHAILLKDHVPDAEAIVFYIDIRATGKGYEEFIRTAQRKYGAQYIRGRVSRMFPHGDKVRVFGVDTLGGGQIKVDADLVVLATAIEPRQDAKALSQLLGIGCDNNGFFNEAHPKLAPVDTMSGGIYIAGAAQFARDIPDTVAMASATASKVCALFSKDKLLSEPSVAYCNVNLCSGCRACYVTCPYDAIEMVEYEDCAARLTRMVAKVNENLCHGCGACVGVCRSGAMNLRAFTNHQLEAQLEALYEFVPAK